MRTLLVIRAGLFLAACTGLAGCSHSDEAPPKETPTVTVSKPLQRQITDFEEYTARTAAVDAVQVRSRVSGYLDQIYFNEGDEVREGDVLYQIDPRPYEATLKQAEAQVRLQEAQLKYQEAVYQRNMRLSRQNSVDIETVQQSLAQRDTTQAQLNAAQANVDQAKLNLEWTHIRAPISGLIGRALVTRGNLIVADQTLLTTIVSQDPMYAYFDVDEPTAERVQQLIRERKYTSARGQDQTTPPLLATMAVGLLAPTQPLGPVLAATTVSPAAIVLRSPVYLQLPTEKDFPHRGYLDFINNQLDPSTATLQVRGIFPNPKPTVGPRVLAPGQFARARVAVSAPYEATLVVQAAVGTDQDQTFVYVVDGQDKVVRHPVKLGRDFEGLQVIAEGLKPDEQVIIEGIQHVSPGVTVKPKLEPMPVPRSGATPFLPAAVLKNPSSR